MLQLRHALLVVGNSEVWQDKLQFPPSKPPTIPETDGEIDPAQPRLITLRQQTAAQELRDQIDVALNDLPVVNHRDRMRASYTGLKVATEGIVAGVLWLSAVTTWYARRVAFIADWNANLDSLEGDVAQLTLIAQCRQVVGDSIRNLEQKLAEDE